MNRFQQICLTLAVAMAVAGAGAAPALADSHVAGGDVTTQDSHVASAPEQSG